MPSRTPRRTALLALAVTPLVMTMIPLEAQAADAKPTMTGNWEGSYVCGQGITGLTLTIARQSGAIFSGTFHFYPLPGNSAAKEGCFAVTGHFVAGRRVFIGGASWISRPTDYITVDLDGDVDAAGRTMKGRVKVPASYGALCSTFQVSLAAGPPVTPGPCQTTKSASIDMPPGAGSLAEQP